MQSERPRDLSLDSGGRDDAAGPALLGDTLSPCPSPLLGDSSRRIRPVPSLALYMYDGIRRRRESRLSGDTVGALRGRGAALPGSLGRAVPSAPSRSVTTAPPGGTAVPHASAAVGAARALSAPPDPPVPSGQPLLPRRSSGQSPHTTATRAAPGAQTPRKATRRTCAAADGQPALRTATGPCWQPAPPRRRKQIFLFAFPSTL